MPRLIPTRLRIALVTLLLAAQLPAPALALSTAPAQPSPRVLRLQLESRQKKGETLNPIERAQLAMLTASLSVASTTTDPMPDFGAFDLSAGPNLLGRMPLLDLITGQRAVDESLQLGTITTGMQRSDTELGSIPWGITEAIDRAIREQGSAPATLDALFPSPGAGDETAWALGMSRPIKEFLPLLDYARAGACPAGQEVCELYQWSDEGCCLPNSLYTVRWKSSMAEDVPLSTLEGAPIKSHDYAAMIDGLAEEPTVPAIASLVPDDTLFFHATRPAAITDLGSALAKGVGSLTAMPDLAMTQTGRLYERLGVPELPGAVDLTSELAFVANDIELLSGDFALLLVPKEGNELLRAVVTGDPARRAVIDDVIVLTTSPAMLARIQAAADEDIPTMAEALDYQYMLGAIEPRRDMLLYLSEPFIRMLTSPQYRIAARRRAAALQSVETLQTMVFAHRTLAGAWPASLQEMADAKYLVLDAIPNAERYTIDAEGIVRDATWGSLYAPTPIRSVQIEKVTAMEKMRSDAFNAEYQEYFRYFFDPIGIAATVSDQIAIHTLILPLIEDTEYNELKTVIGSAKKARLTLVEQPRVPNAASITMGFDMESVLRSIANSMGNARGNAEDSVRQSDLRAMETALEMYGVEGNGFPDALATLVDEQYLRTMPADPDGSAYLYAHDAESYCIAARLSKESVWMMDSDGGSDPNLYELGTYCSSKPFPAATLREDAAPKEPVDPVVQVEQMLIDEMGLDWPKEERMLDFLGDEVSIALGPDTSFNRMPDVDASITVLVKDRAKAERFLRAFIKAVAKELGEDSGFFATASTGLTENEYNGTTYFVLPTGFVNLYVVYFDDRMVLGISQKTVNRQIDGKGESLSESMERGLAFVRDWNDVVAAIDLPIALAWITGLEDVDMAEQELARELLDQDRAVFSTAFTLAKALDGYDGTLAGVQRYFPGIPTGNLVGTYDVQDGTVTLVIGETRAPVTLQRVSRYSQYGRTDSTDATEALIGEKGMERVSAIAAGYKTAVLGFGFTPYGASMKLSVANPSFAQDAPVDPRFAIDTELPPREEVATKAGGFSPSTWFEARTWKDLAASPWMWGGVGALLVIILAAGFLMRRQKQHMPPAMTPTPPSTPNPPAATPPASTSPTTPTPPTPPLAPPPAAPPAA